MSKTEKVSEAYAKAGKPATLTAKQIKAVMDASARIAASEPIKKRILLSISTRKIRRQKMKLSQGNSQIGPAWQKQQAKFLNARVSSRLVEIAAASGGQKRQRVLDRLNRMIGGLNP